MSNKILLSLLLISLSSYSLATENIVFIGDSLTEGYQLPQEASYPSLVQAKINKDGKDYKVINGGVSGSTSASAMSRLNWFLKSKPKVVVLALGSNDGLRGQSISKMKANLSAVIEKAKSKNIKVLLAGLQIPPNYGRDYANKFKDVFVTLSKSYQVELIPFILEGVAGIPKYNLPDGIHPNADGYKIVSETVYKYLEPML